MATTVYEREIRVALPSPVGYFAREPVDDFLGYVVHRAVNGRDLETMLEIPLQERGVQKCLFYFEHA